MSAPETRRAAWHQKRRYVAFVDAGTGAAVTEDGHAGQLPPGFTVGALLDTIPGTLDRVYLVGEPAAGWQAWGLGLGGDHATRWVDGEHYLNEGAPALRYVHRLSGRPVEIRSAGEWFAGVTTIADARAAWELLAYRLPRIADGAQPLAGPAVTGKDVLARLLPRDGVFPVLEESLRAQIHATAPQARFTLVERQKGVKTMPGLVMFDGRVMYGGCLRGEIGSGPVDVHEYGNPMPWDELEPAEQYLPGRVTADVIVPAGWDRVGILPVPEGGGALDQYRWPHEPGERFTGTWDAAEVNLAARHGWDVRIRQHVRMSKGRPLDKWATACEREARAIDADAEKIGPVVARLASRAIRAMVLTAVGSFATRAHRVTHKGTPEELPRGVSEWSHVETGPAAGSIVWTTSATPAAGRWTHPEWSAQVWAKARLWMLEAPTGSPGVKAGALHVPAGDVVAIRADALYLTRDPGWPDDGRCGRLRRQGVTLARRPWPAQWRDLARYTNEIKGGEL